MIKQNEDGSNNLHELTIIIPTFNRPKHLLRLIKYYASKNTNMSFLILDSSDPEISEANRQATTKLGNKARYIFSPQSAPIINKFAEGLELVDTPYCVYCGDDDLIFIEGLSQSLKYIQDHPEYSCVDGIYLNFRPLNHDIHFMVEYSGKGIDADSPVARVFKLFQKYESPFYGVYKTRQLQEVFAGMKKVTSFHYVELYHAVATLLVGKKHRLPVFYGARQSCESVVSERDRLQPYSWFAENSPEFIEYYLQYREELSQFYEKQIKNAPLSREKFNRAMDVAHSVYFITGCTPKFLYEKLQPFWPDDPFQKIDPKNDVCHQFKKAPRRLWDVYIERLLLILQVGLTIVFSWFSVARLNRKTKKETNTNWKCALGRRIRWLSKVDGFRKAYHEICLYLGENNA